MLLGWSLTFQRHLTPLIIVSWWKQISLYVIGKSNDWFKTNLSDREQIAQIQGVTSEKK